MFWMVRTEKGWVGRQGLSGELTDDQPKSFAYTYDTAEDAQKVAEQFGGEVVEG